jgi:hypothetical protein
MKRVIIFIFLLICFISCEKETTLKQDEVVVKKDSIVDPSKCGCLDDIITPPENPKPR